MRQAVIPLVLVLVTSGFVHADDPRESEIEILSVQVAPVRLTKQVEDPRVAREEFAIWFSREPAEDEPAVAAWQAETRGRYRAFLAHRLGVDADTALAQLPVRSTGLVGRSTWDALHAEEFTPDSASRRETRIAGVRHRAALFQRTVRTIPLTTTLQFDPIAAHGGGYDLRPQPARTAFPAVPQQFDRGVWTAAAMRPLIRADLELIALRAALGRRVHLGSDALARLGTAEGQTLTIEQVVESDWLYEPVRIVVQIRARVADAGLPTEAPRPRPTPRVADALGGLIDPAAPSPEKPEHAEKLPPKPAGPKR